MILQGKVALVTGAASGIGRAIAERFAREGARVGVNYRSSRDEAEKVVAEIRAAGGAATAISANVSVESEVRAMIEQVERAVWTPRCAREQCRLEHARSPSQAR